MRTSSEGLSIRAAVFLGFGLIFGLWFFTWFQVSLRITDAQARDAEINSAYRSAGETLASIRTEALNGSVILRNALLDPDSSHLSEYRGQLEQSYQALDRLLGQYKPLLDTPAEHEQFRRLREEMDGFRSTMLEVLATESSSWRAEAGRLLSQRVTPKRDIVMAVSDGVQALGRASYVQRQAEIRDIYLAVQSEMWELLGLALVIGVAVAVLAVLYSGKLERRIRLQMAKGVELTRELQQLSDKLVTAQEQERRQIARELHDEVGQALTAIKVELACAQNSIDDIAGPPNLLHDARSITDGALHQVRDLSYLLHPAALDELGLAAAVDSFMKSFGKRYSIDAQLTHDGMEQRFSADIETATYRIIQEALTNVARHARAKTCQVHLEYAHGSLNILVEDDGAGFNPAAARDRNGLGLIGIRERAFHLGGGARLDSAPGKGTRLSIILPAGPLAEPKRVDPILDPTAA